MFGDWLFLGCFYCVSVVTAADFLWFLNVAMFLKGKLYAVMKTELVFFPNQLEIITKNVFPWKKQLVAISTVN